MKRSEHDDIKSMIDKLRAEASKSSAVSSRTVFELTDPVMDYLARSALPTGRRKGGNSRL